MMRTISITISGKVQGVFFRQGTKEKARELNITGTVSNQPDGSVQVIATGPKEQLDLLITWCRKGPSRAKVDNLVTMELPFREFKDFTIAGN